MRKLFAFYVCMFFTLAGCGETVTSPSPLNPSGIYTLSYTEQSGGTCGAQPGGTITITSVASKFTWDEGGTQADFGSMTCTADNCKGTVSTYPSGAYVSYSVTITSTAMTGTQSITETGGCSSTYNVTGTKN